MAGTIDYADGTAALLDSAQILLDGGHEEEALKLTASVLERNPQSEEALLQFAEVATKAEPFAWIADEQGNTAHIGDLLRKIDLRAFQHHVLGLIERKRYEAALVLLSQGRRRFPEDPSILRSIRVLKLHLEARFLKLLGSLDAVPYATDEPSPDADARHLLPFVDGAATLDELLTVSSLGRFRTLRAFVGMLRGGVIHLAQPSGVRRRSSVPLPAVADAVEEEAEVPPSMDLDEPDPTDTLSAGALLVVRQALWRESGEKPLPEVSRAAWPTEAEPTSSRAQPWLGPLLVMLAVAGVAALVAALVVRAPAQTPPEAQAPVAPEAAPEADPSSGPAADSERAEVTVATYLLEVRSEPPGAEVSVDGNAIGRTPLHYERVGADAEEGAVFQVRVQHAGYQERVMEQRVRGASGSIFTVLERAPRRERSMRRGRRTSRRPDGYRDVPY